VPDLPGYVTTGKTIEEIQVNINEAIDLRLEGLRADDEAIPEPITACAYVKFKSPDILL
jgi:predicted RNase H-like HicB family nuclease